MFDDFVGQQKIKTELTAIVKSLTHNNNGSVNILIRGPAGSGKTLLSFMFLIAICGDEFSKQVPSKNSNNFIFEKGLDNLRCHFVDEVHVIKDFTTMYPLMDCGKYIFIFATNEYGELPDAFLSRCVIFNMEKYSDDEIVKLIIKHAKSEKFILTIESAKVIASVSRGSPRTAKLIFKRLRFLIDSDYCKNNEKSIIASLKNIGIYKGGYTDVDIRYLQTLSKLRTASLLTLSRNLGVDKNTLSNEIEPFLLSKGHILLTRSGRQFVSFSEENNG